MIARMKKFILKIFNYYIKNNVVIVYQMGKVGSSSIETALEASEYEVEHIHSFHSPMTFEMFKNFRSVKYHLPIKTRLRKRFTGLIKKRVFKLRRKKTKIITLFREPISRNISMYFQDIHIPIFEAGKYLDNRNEKYVGTNALRELFLEKFNHDYGIRWFDEEFKKAVGIDPYSIPYDKEKGIGFFENKHFKILLLKLENIDQLQSEIQQFLEIDNFSFNETNRGEKKWYSLLYKQFRSNLNLSNDYIQTLYTSKYMKHFYTSSEIEEFKSKWQGSENEEEKEL
ncbi:putative capsular polysaccharide synthesis family protein [Salibacterium sp. K-3]